CVLLTTARTIFYYYSTGHYHILHSFPTRRSSDLRSQQPADQTQRQRAPGKNLLPHVVSVRHCPNRPHRRNRRGPQQPSQATDWRDRKSTRLNSSHVSISYAVFCLKKNKWKTSE